MLCEKGYSAKKMPPAFVWPAAWSSENSALVLVALILVVVLVLIVLILVVVLVPVLIVVLIAHSRETSFPKTVQRYSFPAFPSLYTMSCE